MGTRTRAATIGAVQALMGKVVHPCNACPTEARSREFHEEYLRRVKELFVAFYKENGEINLTSTTGLPLDTPLSKRSSRLYWELKAWLASQMPPGSKERAYFTSTDTQEELV